MLQGFATINYRADDVEAAKRWYTDVLGIPPRNPHYLDVLGE